MVLSSSGVVGSSIPNAIAACVLNLRKIVRIPEMVDRIAASNIGCSIRNETIANARPIIRDTTPNQTVFELDGLFVAMFTTPLCERFFPNHTKHTNGKSTSGNGPCRHLT